MASSEKKSFDAPGLRYRVGVDLGSERSGERTKWVADARDELEAPEASA